MRVTSLSPRTGFITTSWPTEQRPWAGHFVADLAGVMHPPAQGLQQKACVVAPEWDDERLIRGDVVHLTRARCGGARPPRLQHDRVSAVAALASLAAAVRDVEVRDVEVRDVEVQRWVCHWWPTALALHPSVPRVTVIHGGDVALLERSPRLAAVARGVVGRPVAVSRSVAARWHRATGSGPIAVCPIGAHAARAEMPWHSLPDVASLWAAASTPRLLTVARDAPGKGLAVAREARQLLRDRVDWLVLTPAQGLGPADIRRIVAAADLVVVPSRCRDLSGPRSAARPGEGWPHIITQALVAGVPLVGGPDEAVVAAMRCTGQGVVHGDSAHALVAAVERHLGASERQAARTRAHQAGRALSWSALAPAWSAQLSAALPALLGLGQLGSLTPLLADLLRPAAHLHGLVTLAHRTASRWSGGGVRRHMTRGVSRQ